MDVWDHFYENSVVSEKIYTHYINPSHVWYAQGEIDIAIGQQHKATLWFELEEVFQSEGHHTYMSYYAGWVLDHLRSKEVN